MRKYLVLLLILCSWTVVKAQSYSFDGAHTAQVWGSQPGCLSSFIPPNNWAAITTLSVNGLIDARDFQFVRENLHNITTLDFGFTTIVSYYGYGTNGTRQYNANTIPTVAFSGVSTLTSFVFPRRTTTIESSAFEYSGISTLTNLPYSLKIIEEKAFQFCNNLTSVTIPDQVEEIRTTAFYYCDNLHSIYLPRSILLLNDYAFGECNNLTDVYINDQTPPGSTIVLGDPIPQRNLAVLHVPNGSKIAYANASFWRDFNSIVEGYGTQVTYNGTEVLVKDATPGFIFEGGVDHIESIAKLIITGSIDARDIRSIRDKAEALVDLDMENASIMEYYGTEGTIDGIVQYNANTFPACGMKTSYNCLINTITLPKTLQVIDDESFVNCNFLTTVVIQENIKRIGKYAFGDCDELAYVMILPSMLEIESYAFDQCQKLSIVSVHTESPPDLAPFHDVFRGIPTDCLLRVPENSMQNYTDNTEWSSYFSRIVEGFAPPTVETDGYTNLTSYSALVKATMIDQGDLASKNCGFTWSTTPYPTIKDSYVKKLGPPTTNTTFMHTLDNLMPGTVYYVRSFVWNTSSPEEAGATYGEQMSFKTPAAKLTVATAPVIKQKIYDSSTSAIIASIGTLSGIAEEDLPNLTFSGTAAFTDANPALGKPVTVTYTLGGAAASRYIVPDAYTATGDIYKGLNVSILYEGLWNSSTKKMNKCVDQWDEINKKYLDKYPDDIVDKVSVELFSSSFASPTYVMNGLNLHQNGSITSDGLTAIKIEPTNTLSYYITVKSRNHLPVVSAVKRSFGGNIISWSFIDATTKAFATDIVYTPTKVLETSTCGLYAGNVIYDAGGYQEINTEDLYRVFNQRSELTDKYGYQTEDIDGNGVIDLLDVYLVFHNRDVILYIP